MFSLAAPYVHIENALSPDDLNSLRSICKCHLADVGDPGYVLIDHLRSSTFVKLRNILEQRIGEPLYYLNDFYIYTDRSFSTDWHIDTELFSFDRAVNAWVLLSPACVANAISLIGDINGSADCYFHGVRTVADNYVFANYCSGTRLTRLKAEIEAERIHTPTIRLGDILLIDVKRFHRTNTVRPKHAIAIKFVLKGTNGFLATDMVHPRIWPEAEIFRNLVKSSETWDNVLSGIRDKLRGREGREILNRGFLPEHFDLFRRAAKTL
jgi:hypothetical protein